MSTSLLYHGFGIQGYKYVRTHYENGSVLFTIRQNTKEMRCAACGSWRVFSRGQVWRRFRSVPNSGDSIPILAFGSPFAPVSAFAAPGLWLSPNDQ